MAQKSIVSILWTFARLDQPPRHYAQRLQANILWYVAVETTRLLFLHDRRSNREESKFTRGTQQYSVVVYVAINFTVLDEDNEPE
jgi:hypothetical protein